MRNDNDEPFCDCDGQEAPFGLSGFYCDECRREIAVTERNPLCDFAYEVKP